MQFSKHEEDLNILENVELDEIKTNKNTQNTFKETDMFDTYAFEEAKSKISNKYDPNKNYTSENAPNRLLNLKINKISNDDFPKMFKRDAIYWHLTIAQPGMESKGKLLQRLFTVLKFGGLMYSPSHGEWLEWSETPHSIATAISHGQNIIIQLPPCDKIDNRFWKWLITGDRHGDLSNFISMKDSKETENEEKILFKRKDETFTLEHSEPQNLLNGRKKYVSERVIFSNQNENKFSSINDENDHKTFGINIPFGGHLQKNFFNEIISANGYHGHLFLHYLPSQNNRYGGILIGLENCEPGKHSVFGNKTNFTPAYGYTWKYLGSGPKEFDSMIIDLPSNWSDIEKKSLDFKYEWIYQTSEINRNEIENLKVLKNESKKLEDLTLQFKISDPIQKQEENMIGTTYWVYPITTMYNGNDSEFVPELSVNRRFSDFEWLYNNLTRKYPGFIIPMLPEKTYNVEKFIKLDSNRKDDRKTKFYLFLKKIGEQKEIRKDLDFKMFLNGKDDQFKKQKEEKIPTELDVLSSKTTYQWFSSFFNFSSVKSNEIIDLLQKIRNEKINYYEKLRKLIESFKSLLLKEEEMEKFFIELSQNLNEMSSFQQEKKNELFSYKLNGMNDISLEYAKNISIFRKECQKCISMLEFQMGILESIELQIKTQETIKKKIDEETSSNDKENLSKLLKNVNDRFLNDYGNFQICFAYELEEIISQYFKLQFTIVKKLYEKI